MAVIHSSTQWHFIEKTFFLYFGLAYLFQTANECGNIKWQIPDTRQMELGSEKYDTKYFWTVF